MAQIGDKTRFIINSVSLDGEELQPVPLRSHPVPDVQMPVLHGGSPKPTLELIMSELEEAAEESGYESVFEIDRTGDDLPSLPIAECLYALEQKEQEEQAKRFDPERTKTVPGHHPIPAITHVNVVVPCDPDRTPSGKVRATIDELERVRELALLTPAALQGNIVEALERHNAQLLQSGKVSAATLAQAKVEVFKDTRLGVENQRRRLGA